MDRARGPGIRGGELVADTKAQDETILRLARKISYVIDPDNEYPENYTGHVRVELDDGTVIERRRPHMRGGAREPLTHADIVAKFRANVGYGGWPETRGDALLGFCETLGEAKDLAGLAAFRG